MNETKEELIAEINENITSNGNREITGEKLRDVLIDIVDNTPTVDDLPITSGSGNPSLTWSDTSSVASGGHSVSLGTNSTASGAYSHTEGYGTRATGQGAHAEGYFLTGSGSIIAAGTGSHAEGYASGSKGVYAGGTGAHAEGVNTTASSSGSHAEGNSTAASGSNAHAEGFNTKALGTGSHAEGNGSTASGHYSHAEGQNTYAVIGAHAEGYYSTASGDYSHAEGQATYAAGRWSHAEGGSAEMDETGGFAYGIGSHAEGCETEASGSYSHAEGWGTIASRTGSHAEGKWNKSNQNTIHSVGIGTNNNNRRNAFEILEDGKVYVIGIGDYDGTNPTDDNTLQKSISDTEDVFIATYGQTTASEVVSAVQEGKLVFSTCPTINYYEFKDAVGQIKYIPLNSYDVDEEFDQYSASFTIVLFAKHYSGEEENYEEGIAQITTMVTQWGGWSNKVYFFPSLATQSEIDSLFTGGGGGGSSSGGDDPDPFGGNYIMLHLFDERAGEAEAGFNYDWDDEDDWAMAYLIDENGNSLLEDSGSPIRMFDAGAFVEDGEIRVENYQYFTDIVYDYFPTAEYIGIESKRTPEYFDISK